MIIEFNEPEEKKFRKISDGLSHNEKIYEFISENDDENKKKSKPLNQALIDAELSVYFFEYLKNFNVPVYYKSKQGMNGLLIKDATELPFKVIIHNVAVGSFAKQYNFEDHMALHAPVFNFFLTDEKFNKFLINESYLPAYGIVEPDELKLINKHLAKANAILKSFFNRRSLSLDEMEIRFVKYRGNLLLGYEFSSVTLVVSETNTAKKYKHLLTENYSLALYERVIGL